jgi:hypothetical protein
LLGDGGGPPADQEVQQLVGLRLQRPRLALLEELTSRAVEHEGAEADAHGRRKAGKAPEKPGDFGMLAAYFP